MSATTTETLEARRERASLLLARLRQEYPDAQCSLNFSNPLELLVATILSAQCTDERVNQVTESLFQKYRAAEDYARAPLEALEQDIRQTGFYRNKAKHIREAAALLVAEYGGAVPADMAALLTLPGVARKTANVVLGNAFGVIEGVVVDTHVGRLARRMGFTQSEDPAKIEQDLMALFPPADWLDLSHILIYHGRSVCQARKPLCNLCAVANLCPTGAEILGIALDLPQGM
ncbi:MAG TPA: endonuclease III [Ktedonobacterales bacterium]|jgi:endonuclease-3